MTGRGDAIYTLAFAAFSLWAIVFVPYHRYVGLLKWLTLSLLTYVGVVFAVRIDWWSVVVSMGGAAVRAVARHDHACRRSVRHHHQPLSVLLAELAGGRGKEADRGRPADQPRPGRPASSTASAGDLGRHGALQHHLLLHHADDGGDSCVGQTDIRPGQGCQERCGRSRAGGLPAVQPGTDRNQPAMPVLAGSAAYAVAEAYGWRTGLERPLGEARPFYLVIALAMVLGVGVDFHADRADQRR